MPKKTKAQEPLKFIFRYHASVGKSRRVWRNDWASDMFEVLDQYEFQVLSSICHRFSIPLEEADDD